MDAADRGLKRRRDLRDLLDEQLCTDVVIRCREDRVAASEGRTLDTAIHDMRTIRAHRIVLTAIPYLETAFQSALGGTVVLDTPYSSVLSLVRYVYGFLPLEYLPVTVSALLALYADCTTYGYAPFLQAVWERVAAMRSTDNTLSVRLHRADHERALLTAAERRATVEFAASRGLPLDFQRKDMWSDVVEGLSFEGVRYLVTRSVCPSGIVPEGMVTAVILDWALSSTCPRPPGSTSTLLAMCSTRAVDESTKAHVRRSLRSWAAIGGRPEVTLALDVLDSVPAVSPLASPTVLVQPLAPRLPLDGIEVPILTAVAPTVVSGTDPRPRPGRPRRTYTLA
jgi:hypothetical protein